RPLAEELTKGTRQDGVERFHGRVL
ncbi:MAG: hypothetical protein H6Q10_2226, partial [Acidobacteria bacterium]|nr:hypothetical protein [Acidobacteriota bacterium]